MSAHGERERGAALAEFAMVVPVMLAMLLVVFGLGRGFHAYVARNMVEVSGSNFDLRPHQHGVLFHAEGTQNPSLKVSGSGGDWRGIMYAPRGTAEISGQGNINLSGGIVAKRVKLNGSNATIDGNVGASPSSPAVQTIGLIE